MIKIKKDWEINLFPSHCISIVWKYYLHLFFFCIWISSFSSGLFLQQISWLLSFSPICPYLLIQKVLIKSWSIPQENFSVFNLIKYSEAKTIHNNDLHLCCSVTIYITLHVWSIQCLGTDCILTVFVIDCDFCILINLSCFLFHDYQLYCLAVSIKNTILLRVLPHSL